jgi:chromosome segregation ATPase
MSNLAEKGQELKRVTAKLQSLYDKLDTKQIEQRELESKIESYKLKLQRAEKLISALSEEKTRFFLMSPFFLFLINICFLLN